MEYEAFALHEAHDSGAPRRHCGAGEDGFEYGAGIEGDFDDSEGSRRLGLMMPMHDRAAAGAPQRSQP